MLMLVILSRMTPTQRSRIAFASFGPSGGSAAAARMMRVLAVLAAAAALAAAASSDSGEKVEKIEIVRTPKDGQVTATEGGVVMMCLYNVTEASTQEPVKVEWFEGSEEGGDPTKVEEGVSVSEDGTSVLTVEEDYKAEYTCKAGNEQQSFTVKKFFKLEKWEQSVVVFQGEDHKLYCKIKDGSNKDGTITFEWYVKDVDDPQNDTNRNKVNTAENVTDGEEQHFKILGESGEVLKIEDARYEDRAIYQCEVTRDEGDAGKEVAHVQIMVRVRDKYAALYPFVGIVAEVVVLCLIIFVCEKRRTSKEAVDDDEEEEFNGAAGGSGAAGNSNVRHRRN